MCIRDRHPRTAAGLSHPAPCPAQPARASRRPQSRMRCWLAPPFSAKIERMFDSMTADWQLHQLNELEWDAEESASLVPNLSMMASETAPAYVVSGTRDVPDGDDGFEAATGAEVGSPLEEALAGLDAAIDRLGSVQLVEHSEQVLADAVRRVHHLMGRLMGCLLYTSDAADDLTRVDLGGR